MNHVDNPFQSPAVLSICPGIRGLERGLERAIGRINVVAYVEIEAFIIENLVQQMEQGLLAPAPIWSDVKTFDALPFRNKIHGLIGGYPCKPFSIIGKQNGEEHPEHLWPYVKGGVAAGRPLFCFFENVANHLHIGYDIVRSDLQRLDYTVKEGIYSAVGSGATHKRERLFILAVDNTQREGLERLFRHGNISERWQNKSRPACPASIFPRERGLSQWEWEEPRTLDIKSGVGCTVNGYNYWRDIISAYGNSVVEQTAEIAFIDLLNKHFS